MTYYGYGNERTVKSKREKKLNRQKTTGLKWKGKYMKATVPLSQRSHKKSSKHSLLKEWNKNT